MNQQQFVARYEPLWRELETLLDALEARRPASTEFPFLYRQACQHLALARDRGYGTHLVERLNQLVLRGHQQLYQPRTAFRSRIADYAAAGFPSRVRSEARLVWLAAALFFLPGLAMLGAVIANPDLVYSVMSASHAATLEEMYRPDAAQLGRERPSDSDFMMFGSYVEHNVSIAFQTFAGGILFGVGAVFFLVFNGVVIGAVAGHLVNAGYGSTFLPFVVGHGAFELTALVLAGATGLKLGFALLSPGRCTRREALKAAARDAVGLLYGTAAMLVIAAFVEAFWSSSATLPGAVKYAVGAAFWLAVLGYFAMVGRSRGS